MAKDKFGQINKIKFKHAGPKAGKGKGKLRRILK
jgi:hypothetical protein